MSGSSLLAFWLLPGNHDQFSSLTLDTWPKLWLLAEGFMGMIT
jgi:hypothetical protein